MDDIEFVDKTYLYDQTMRILGNSGLDFMPYFFSKMGILTSIVPLFCLFDLILYVPSTISQLYRDGTSWVEPVLGLSLLYLLVIS